MTDVPFQSLTPRGAWELLGEPDRASDEHQGVLRTLRLVPTARPASSTSLRRIG